MARREKAGRDQPRADALEQGVDLFQAGDYVAARAMITQASQDRTISETQRAFARSVLAAMAVDRLTLFVGLGCALFAVIIVASTAFLQP
ncbi:MAG: hypothetical protein IPK13_18810 [Deltaproteobacteria bacterium]|nr:hypothetical protein [Deltaproteobacteria bacterium]